MITITTATQTLSINRLLDRESDYWETTRNTTVTLASDGSVISRSNGTAFVTGQLVIKYLDKEYADALRELIARDIRFIGEFSITPNAGADIGAGDGIELIQCFWNGAPNTKTYIKDIGKGLKYNVVIPFISTKNITGNGGTAVRR